MANTPVLGTGAERFEGSSPSPPTKGEAMQLTLEQAIAELKQQKNHRQWMVERLVEALELIDKTHPAYAAVCAAAFIDTRPLTQAELDYAATLVPTIT